MKIVVLDGQALNPGDLSWAPLKALGDVQVFERTNPKDVLANIGDAEVIFTNKTPLQRETVRKMPNVKYIGVLATGYNVVNVDSAVKRGIVVTNVPDYATNSVAQHVFALLLELTNEVSHHAHTVRRGRWARHPDWCYWLHPLRELAGLTMGLVGYGRIGRKVGEIATAFGMNLLVYDLSRKDAELDDIFRRSDVISLHCPLTPETEKLINPYRLSLMKPSALLINTSRGGLVDEKALADALTARTIAGAGLDVLAVEPPPANHPLYNFRNCVITPHQAWGTLAARGRLLDMAVENLKAWIAGQPQNVVGR